MMKMNILNTGKLFLLFIVLVLSGQQVRAGVNGLPILSNPGVTSNCAPTGSTSVGESQNVTVTLSGQSCYLIGFDEYAHAQYVPHSGTYKIRTKIIADGIFKGALDTTSGEFDASVPLTNQDVTVSQAGSLSVDVFGQQRVYVCEYYVDSEGNEYSVSVFSPCTEGSQPLPPTPAPPDTSCTLNNGNALNVNLSTVDRAQMPTVPGSGSMRHIQVPVDCTGADVTVNMQLNYTPISLSGGQVIKSSSNGLGVSVVYNNKILSSTDVTPVTFLVGANSIDLAFQAVRDPAVEIKDVPTGEFTASAVLVMTQQ